MVNYDKRKRREQKESARMSAALQERDTARRDSDLMKGVLVSTMHEVRRFSSELSTYAEALMKELAPAVQLPTDRTRELAENVFYASGLLAARLGFTDIELNPDSVRTQTRLRAGIYKKFEKARYMLNQRAKTRAIEIRFSGSSYFEIDALQSFELVPFVILDNAVKYSPHSQTVDVNFIETARDVEVEVSSMGPTFALEDSAKLFSRGERGSNAVKAGIPGEGLGLYLAKLLCDLHNVQLLVRSAPTPAYKYRGVDHSPFVAQFRFTKHA